MFMEAHMTHSDDDVIRDALDAISPAQWDRLSHLANLVLPYDPGEWQGGHVMGTTSEGKPIIAMPFYMYSRALNDLVDFMYECNFIVGFDWTRWPGQYQDRINAMSLTESTPVDLLKYIVTVVRTDRFCEGYLANEIISRRFLDRLNVIIQHYRPAATNDDRTVD
jgi:hypothetical protein